MKTYGNKKASKKRGPIKTYGKMEDVSSSPEYPTPAIELANKKQQEIAEKAIAKRRKKEIMEAQATRSFAKQPLPPIPRKRKICLEDVGIF